MAFHYEKSRLGKTKGATNVQIYNAIHTHEDAIFTQTEAQLLERLEILALSGLQFERMNVHDFFKYTYYKYKANLH